MSEQRFKWHLKDADWVAILNVWFSVLTLLCIWPAAGWAGVISIEIRTTVKVTGDKIEVQVRGTNQGDETAHNVQIHLHLLGGRQQSQIFSAIQPGKFKTAVFEKNVSNVKPGRHPLTVRVFFHDANQYPFSALSGMTFSVVADVNPDLVIDARDVSLHGRGRLVCDVKNLGSSAREIKGRIILPRELVSKMPETSFSLAARSQKQIDFEIENFAALDGATYPLVCYFEYDEENVHHTALARPMVRIVAAKNLFSRTRWLWVGLAVILAILLSIILAGKKKRVF